MDNIFLRCRGFSSGICGIPAGVSLGIPGNCGKAAARGFRRRGITGFPGNGGLNMEAIELIGLTAASEGFYLRRLEPRA